MEAQVFEGWAILELMGHRKLAGLVSQAEIAGAAFVRIDVPGPDVGLTQFYSPAAVYSITPVAEAIARGFASQLRPVPVTRWELPAPATEPNTACAACAHEEADHSTGGACLHEHCICPEFKPAAQRVPADG